MDATDTFTFEMIILPVNSIIGRVRSNNLLLQTILLYVKSKEKHLWPSYAQVTLMADAE